MGGIVSFLKGGVTSMVAPIRNMDIGGQLDQAMKAANIPLKMPEIDTSGIASKIKLDDAVTDIKMPWGVSNYISPVINKALSHIDLPSEIGGISMPSLPDLSSVASDLDGFLSGIGIDTDILGIRSVSEILEMPDLASLAKPYAPNRIDLDNLPDLTSVMDGFDTSGLESEFTNLRNYIPEMSNFDLDVSQFF